MLEKNIFIHPAVAGPLGSFQDVAVTNCEAVNMGVPFLALLESFFNLNDVDCTL